MRALSLRQPYAHAVVHFGKSLENRRWSTKYRGPILIHAAKGMTGAEYEDAEDFIADTLSDLRWRDHSCERFALRDAARAEFAAHYKVHAQRGGIIGRARIVDVIPPCFKEDELFSECKHPWHIPFQFAFVLEDIEPLPFVPWKGELSLFEVREDYAEVAAQLAKNRTEDMHALALALGRKGA